MVDVCDQLFSLTKCVTPQTKKKLGCKKQIEKLSQYVISCFCFVNNKLTQEAIILVTCHSNQ